MLNIMDDAQAKTPQTSQTDHSAQPVAPASSPVTSPPIAPPVSTGRPGKKESETQGPVPTSYAEADKVAKTEGDDYWESYAREIEIEKEIAEMGGVEKVESGEVKVPEDVAKEMGIKPTVTVETPIEKATGFSIGRVSLDDTKLAMGIAKPTSTGLRWLAEWFIYQLRKAHFLIKKVKGQIIRQKLPQSQ